MKKTKSKPAARRTATKAAPARTARAAAKAPAKQAAKPMDEAAMMAAWEKAMTPAAGHARLEPLVGTFATRTTIWMEPGAPPQVSEGVSEHRWVLGGRWLEQSYRGSAMGMPFEGLGFTGYDNVAQKYQGTWMDTFGTGVMVSEGIGRPTDKQIQFEAHAGDPCGTGPMQFRTVLRIRDRDHHSFEMFRILPGGKEYRSMLCEYTRK